jgi:phosphoglycerate dehydrogenase-like enzyme
MLAEADVVAICVPLTAETERLFDTRAFAAMKPGAYLINVARGRVVDTGALLAAIKSGRLAGAGLDVTDPEPLPADHALWREPGVIITPHVAGDAELTRERGRELFLENVRRFGAGEPLLNVVDKEAGY